MSVVTRTLARFGLEDFYAAHPVPEYLPVPWYGRVRRWLSQGPYRLALALERWAVKLDQVGDVVEYRAKPKERLQPSAGNFPFCTKRPISAGEVGDGATE